MRVGTSAYADTAFGYCRDVLSGRKPACLQIRQACQRFISDADSEQWVFDAAKAHRACDFIERLPHTEGALAGERIKLEPWQVFAICAIFGLVDQDGLRKHREVFALIPRKNGKSTIAAGIANYMLVADGEAGAQVFIGANSKEQANYCFKPARLMASKALGFAQRFGVRINKESLTLADGSYLKMMIGKPGDGGSPHCAVLDEAHENDSPDQYNTMKTGQVARRQPLLITITTAGTNTAGPCRELQLWAEQVLAGTIKNDRLFALIYTIDKDDDWKDIEVWKKANPNYGVSFEVDKLQEYLDEALSRPAMKVDKCTKHLNVWESSRAAWLNMADWDACATAPSFDEVSDKGYPAWVAFDTSTKMDISAVAALVQLPDGKKAIYPFLHLPHAATEKSKNATGYAQWVDAGFIKASEGDATDFSALRADLEMLKRSFAVQSIAYDQWQGFQLAQEMADDIIPIYEFKQTFEAMHPAMVEFEAALARKEIIHPDNRALNWMARNVTCARRGEQMRPSKPAEHLKIDGIVASLMATGLSLKDPVPTAQVWMEWLD